MIGITNGRKDLPYRQTMICPRCGRYGSFTVYVTFMQLLLFFIPCFKWNRQYFVETSCCGTVYQLNPETGRRIEKGEDLTISDADLTPLSYAAQSSYSKIKTCSCCGYTTEEDFSFCPKCGKPF